MKNQNENIKVLLVDDEVEFLESTKKVLSRRGMDIKTTQNGYHALKWLKLEKFDVVVLDIKMPGMEGEEVFYKIKQQWPDLPVIILTGFGTTQQAFRTSKEGIYDYLSKPCDPEILSCKIRNACMKNRIDKQKNSSKIAESKIHLLIADDEEELLNSLSKVLSRRNMEVTTAINGSEALHLINEKQFEVAVIDIKMPGIDGIELLANMKKMCPVTEVIILTGHGRQGMHEEA